MNHAELSALVARTKAAMLANPYVRPMTANEVKDDFADVIEVEEEQDGLF